MNHTTKQLKDMSETQLQRLAGELRHEIQSKSFQASLGEHKKTHEHRQVRRTLARVLTILSKPKA